MNLEETIIFKETTADAFGDDEVTVVYETDAAVEQSSSFLTGLNSEEQAGELNAWIYPDSDVWQEKHYGITGMLAEYAGTSFRVTQAHAGGSLLCDEEDLVELTLSKNNNDVE